MIRLIPLFLLFLVSPTFATPIVIDPSDFPAGTDVSNAYRGITLYTAQGTMEIFGLMVTNDLHLISDLKEPVFITGSTFTHPGGDIWSAGQCCGGDEVLEINFTVPIRSATVLFHPDDTDTGIVQAYDAVGILIDEQLFRSSSPFQITVSTLAPSIRQILATGGDTLRIGQVSYVQISEPTTLALFGVSLLGIGLHRYKRKSN